MVVRYDAKQDRQSVQVEVLEKRKLIGKSVVISVEFLNFFLMLSRSLRGGSFWEPVLSFAYADFCPC